MRNERVRSLLIVVSIIFIASTTTAAEPQSDRNIHIIRTSAPPKANRAKAAGKARSDRPSTPGARFIGQDGRDVIGTENVAAGNGVLDIKIELYGIPVDRTIAFLVVKGLGGGEWTYNGPKGPWKWAQIVREPGSTTVDLYIEPYQVETGRPLTIQYRLDDGKTFEFTIQGGAADPAKRAKGEEIKARFVGQDGADFVSASPSVGPDGYQDVHIQLSSLPIKLDIESATIAAKGKPTWKSGSNPQGLFDIHIVRDPKNPRVADLYFAADREARGKPLAIEVRYKNGTTDRIALASGNFDPSLKTPPVARLPIIRKGLSARRLGQDGASPVDRLSDEHIELTGIPANAEIVAATLGDAADSIWSAKTSGNSSVYEYPYSRRLTFVRKPGGASADLYFPPYRDESAAKMTIRLAYSDGSLGVCQFQGGKIDIDRLIGRIDRGEVDAKPGDDLGALADRFGVVRLKPNTKYPMRKPIVLEKQTTIIGGAGSAIVFEQAPTDPPWSAAIKFHASNTTLENFSIRFIGPIRMRNDVDHGPAVVASTQNLDPPRDDPKHNTKLRNLDIEGPQPHGDYEEAVKLMMLASATSGEIVNNTLTGGTVEFIQGPWRIEGNDFRGTLAHTYNYAVFAGHLTHDLLLKGNKARQTIAGGKTWRFLVLTQRGHDDRVIANDISGIGPRDGEKFPDQNSPEVILTEAYRLRFEGKPAAISADGRIVRVRSLQGDQPLSGDVVSIVSGSNAGEWRAITQILDPLTYLLDEPLPKVDGAIAIAEGFVRETFDRNVVDCRDGAVAGPLILVGNHYGSRVTHNHLIGSGDVFLIASAPTEQPVHWGWSHAPMMGILVEGNVFENSSKGGRIEVQHGAPIKSNRGRVYMTITFKDNTFVWTRDFFNANRGFDGRTLTSGRFGFEGGLDPGELVVTESGTKASYPSGRGFKAAIKVVSAIFNGKPTVNRSIPVAEGDRKGSTAATGNSFNRK